MPKILIEGVPESTSRNSLRELRRELISTLEESMGIETGITRVFFPADLAGDPDQGQDDQIWVFLYTGMLRNKPAAESKGVTAAIAEVVKAAFRGMYGVEMFIIDLDFETRALLHAD